MCLSVYGGLVVRCRFCSRCERVLLLSIRRAGGKCAWCLARVSDTAVCLFPGCSDGVFNSLEHSTVLRATPVHKGLPSLFGCPWRRPPLLGADHAALANRRRLDWGIELHAFHVERRTAPSNVEPASRLTWQTL